MDSNPIELDILTSQDLGWILQTLNHYLESNRAGAILALSQRKNTSFIANYIKNNECPLPLRSLFRVLVKKHGATCCLREYPYLDMGYWDSYSSFYSRCFKIFKKNCERLHFFRGPEGNEVALRDAFSGHAQTENCLSELEFEYLGFVVLRPTDSYCVGRTALLFDNRRGKDLPHSSNSEDPEYEGRPRNKGASKQWANLMCARLSVNAVPYIQQDVVTGMCATASLWTASQVLAERHELHRFPYLQITRQAVSAVSDDETIARGLYPAEIVRALQSTGARVESYFPPFSMKGRADRQNVNHMRDILYAYIESHIPVIVLLPGHAVCCNGHLQPHLSELFLHDDDTEKMPTVYPGISKNHYFVSETVPRFYAHNDSYGPYDRLDFLDPREHADINAARDPKEWLKCPVSLGKTRSGPLELQGLIVPVPPYVRTSPRYVAIRASQTFSLYFGVPGVKEREVKVLWRILLTKGSKFKQSLARREFMEPVRNAYASFHLPKYIWLCEFSLFMSDETEEVLGSHDRRRINGEFIYDTSTPSFNVHPIVYRFGPYFIAAPSEDPREAEDRNVLKRKGRLLGANHNTPAWSFDEVDDVQ